jgi:hypothetical protein
MKLTTNGGITVDNLPTGKDNIYLNIVINQNGVMGNAPTPALYDEHLTTPILMDASKYYCSIVRFTIPLNAIPLIIVPLLVTQPNPNILTLIMGISYLGVDYPVNLIYTPNSTLLPPTPGPGPIYFTNSQASGPYYWVQSITNLIDMFNTAIRTAMTNAGLGAVTAPFYIYNPVTQLLSLQVAQDFINTGAAVYFNEQTNHFGSGFNTFFYGYNQPNGKDYSHILLPLPPNSPVGGPYVYSEDYITIDLWFSLRRLIVTTDTIPINTEYVPTQNPNQFGANTGINSSLPIITDFIPQLTFANEARSIAYYNPTSQYRLVDLVSEAPIRRLNFRIYWEDKFGNLFPLLISIFQQVSMKIAFIRKELYNPIKLLLQK